MGSHSAHISIEGAVGRRSRFSMWAEGGGGGGGRGGGGACSGDRRMDWPDTIYSHRKSLVIVIHKP